MILFLDFDGDHLVQTDGSTGLSDPVGLEKLAVRLRTADYE